jgi:hypothetical protein
VEMLYKARATGPLYAGKPMLAAKVGMYSIGK